MPIHRHEPDGQHLAGSAQHDMHCWIRDQLCCAESIGLSHLFLAEAP